MKKNKQFRKYLGIFVVILLLCVFYPLWNGAENNGDNASGNVDVEQDSQDVWYEQADQSGQSGQDSQGAQGSQSGQDALTGQDVQDGQDIWESHGTQDDIDHPDVDEPRYTFRNEKYLDEHFEKHGSEFDYATKEEYVAGANRVIASEEALYKTEAEDGDHIYYLESSNEIVFLSVDGYIRTYFKPQAGKKYYDRQ